MRFTITHEGVPIGTVELAPGADRVTGPVDPLPAYGAVRPLVRAASEALGALVVGAPAPAPAAGRGAAFARAAALGRALELRDAWGGLVATDFIELLDRPGAEPPLAAFVGFRMAPAGAPAPAPPRRGGGPDASRPEA